MNYAETYLIPKEIEELEEARALFYCASEGIIVTDDIGKIKHINPIAEKMFGYKKGELKSRNIEELVLDRFSTKHKQFDKYNNHSAFLANGIGKDVYGMKKNGTKFPIEISLSSFSNGVGNFVIAFIIDITDRKKAEEELKQSKQILQNILDNTSEQIFSIDKNFKILSFNKTFFEFVKSQFNREPVLGESVKDFIPEPHISVEANFNKALKGETFHVEGKYFFNKNENWFYSTYNPIYENGEITGIAIFSKNITIRKNAEESAKRQKEELEKLNKELDSKVEQRTQVLEEAIVKLNHTEEKLNTALKKEKELNDLKSRFISTASHEFRTPLTTILSSLSLAKTYGKRGEKEKQEMHLDRILTTVKNLSEIVNDLLSVSKLEEGKIIICTEKFNGIDFVNTIIKELRLVAKLGQVINYSYSGETEIYFDKKILRHLLYNLISNAIKFSAQEKCIEVDLKVDDLLLTLSVKDNGIGISKEDQEHLFERFFRAHNAENIQGTGLGLNIVGKYVELLNGNIECKSVLGNGTMFTIKLPKNHNNE